MYKERNGLLPIYLHELFPPLVNATTRYGLRNNDDFITLSRRLETYAKSVIPDSIRLWNNLDTRIRNAPSLNTFKTILKEKYKTPTVPPFFFHGDRYYNVMHTRIRNRCSNLNNDLFFNHLRDNPDCSCGRGMEDADHFFFKCPLFINQRITLFTSTRNFHPLNADKLLFGIDSLSDDDNSTLFLEVQTFIKNSKRFKKSCLLHSLTIHCTCGAGMGFCGKRPSTFIFFFNGFKILFSYNFYVF